MLVFGFHLICVTTGLEILFILDNLFGICRKIKIYFHLCGVLSVGYIEAGIYIDRAHDVFKARYDVFFLLDQILPSLSTVQGRPTNYAVFVQQLILQDVFVSHRLLCVMQQLGRKNGSSHTTTHLT